MGNRLVNHSHTPAPDVFFLLERLGCTGNIEPLHAEAIKTHAAGQLPLLVELNGVIGIYADISDLGATAIRTECLAPFAFVPGIRMSHVDHPTPVDIRHAA